MKSATSSPFEHLIIPTLSFFNERGEVDFVATAQYINALNKSPVTKLILFGTTGEGVALSVSEKRDLLRCYEENLSQRIEIIVSTGMWCIKDIESLLADTTRVQTILQLPTVYYKRDDPQLIRFFTSLSKAILQAIYLYHLPKNTLYGFTAQDVLAYREAHATISGIKLSHSSLAEIASFSALEHFAIWYGSDKHISQALEAGASGVVCQNLAAALEQMHEECDMDDIQNIADNVRRRIELGQKGRKIGMLKTVLNDMSTARFPTFVRAPAL